MARNPPIAHVSEDGRLHRLEDHLIGTAQRAAQMAAEFGASEWGYIAGLWHDLGKYSAAFQRYLESSSDKDCHAAESRGSVDHSTAGAQHAAVQMKVVGHLLAYAISGHHAGLLDSIGEGACLDRRLRKEVEPWKTGSYVPPEHPLPQLPRFLRQVLARRADDSRFVAFSFALFTRMLFSCLVDADFLDTEEFMDPARGASRQVWPEGILSRMGASLDSFVATEFAVSSTDVDRWRREVRESCLSAASSPPGLFSLTVPTGGGKTLGALAFGLRHAAQHGLARIVYVAPFTSIIEQNAKVFRRVFAPIVEEGLPDVVLEHHSDADVEKETLTARLATENWDAPLVVTTAVQFYESLFANRTKRCRKLHNLARSVIILDEAQELPVDYLHPCLMAIRELASHYSATVVLCTATQPAVHRRVDFPIGLDGVREIVPDPPGLYRALRRVKIDDMGLLTDLELASRLASLPQVLCIVNTRRQARTLFDLIAEEPGTFHLSASMCPCHRLLALENIRKELKDGRPCRLIATQVVEAGVDIDFPVVFRSMAGLDSIAQAAGRCNRNGRQKEATAFVFRSEHVEQEVFLRDTACAAAQIVGGDGHPPLYADLLSIEALQHYFRLYYWSQQTRWDKHKILDELGLADRPELPFLFNFASIDSRFRFIDDHEEPVIVGWKEEGAGLCRSLEWSPFPDVRLLRRLQRFTVSVPRRTWHRQLGRAIRLVNDRFPVLCGVDFYYDKHTGLNLEREELAPNKSVV